MVRKFLPWLNLVLCVICLLLIMIDAIWTKLYLFNGKFVKAYVLVTSLVTAANAIMLISRYRAGTRRRRR